MFPGVKAQARVHVTESGTLSIQSARSEDSGEYSCQALNAAGSSFANAHITVTGPSVCLSVRLSLYHIISYHITKQPTTAPTLRICSIGTPHTTTQLYNYEIKYTAIK